MLFLSSIFLSKNLDNISKIFRWYSYHGLDINPMDVLDVIHVSGLIMYI